MCFCHTSTCVSHWCTRVPLSWSPPPPSLPHLPKVPDHQLCVSIHASNLHTETSILPYVKYLPFFLIFLIFLIFPILKTETQDKQNTNLTHNASIRAAKELVMCLRKPNNSTLSNRALHSNINKLAYSQGKAPNEEEKFLAEHTRATYPTVWMGLSTPKCRFAAPVAKFWGSRCCFGEFWMQESSG